MESTTHKRKAPENTFQQDGGARGAPRRRLSECATTTRQATELSTRTPDYSTSSILGGRIPTSSLLSGPISAAAAEVAETIAAEEDDPKVQSLLRGGFVGIFSPNDAIRALLAAYPDGAVAYPDGADAGRDANVDVGDGGRGRPHSSEENKISWKWRRDRRRKQEVLRPAPGAAAELEAIVVYYHVKKERTALRSVRPTYDIFLTGFEFSFSDGGEIRSNDNKASRLGTHVDSHRTAVRFKEGERVLKVQCAYERGQFSKKLLGISFEMSSGRTLAVSAPRATLCTTYRETTSVAHGRTLRCIDVIWDIDESRMLKLVTIPRASLKRTRSDERGPPSIVSLSSLALGASMKKMAADALEVESRSRSLIERSRKQRDAAAGDVTVACARALQQSPEAKEVRKLRAALKMAENRLCSRALGLSQAGGMQVSEIEKTRLDNDTAIRARWKRDRAAVLESQDSQVKMLVRMGIVDRHKVLCNVPTCRRLFDPHTLTECNTCDEDACRFSRRNCGCEIQLCDRCNAFLCREHLAAHEPHCKAREAEELLLDSGLPGYGREPRLSVKSV